MQLKNVLLLPCLTWFLLAAAQDPAPEPVPDVPQERGVYGTEAPQPAELLGADRLVHEDTTGGALQELLCLAGAPGQGFAAIWRDTRDGNAGLYFGRLDAEGQPREPERPLYRTCSSGRELEPALALGPNGHGAFAWYSSGTANQVVKLRTFAPDGTLLDAEVRLGSKGDKTAGERPSAFADAGGRGRGGRAAHRLPSVAVDEDGEVLVAWLEEGEVWAARVAADGSIVDEPHRVLPELKNAIARPVVSFAQYFGEVATIDWATGPLQGVHVFAEVEALSGGPWPDRLRAGELSRNWSVAGWTEAWYRGRETTEVVERRGSTDHEQNRLERDRDGWRITTASRDTPPAGHEFDLSAAPGEQLTFAVLRASDDPVPFWPSGYAVLRIPSDVRGVSLQWHGPKGVPLWEKELACLSDRPGEVSSPMLAASGPRLLFAWTEIVDGQKDVFFRLVTPEGELGPARRWNTDTASSDQLHPVVGGDGTGRCVATWADAREGPWHVRMRGLDARGAPTTAELRLPVVTEAWPALEAVPDLCARPVVSLVPPERGGRVLVTWKARVVGQWFARAQAFGADLAPLGPEVDVDPGHPSKPGAAALTPLADGGWAIALAREGQGMWVRRLAPDASARGEALRVSAHALARNPALTTLDGGRVACAWDVTAPQGNKAVRGRLLTRDLALDSDVLEFPLQFRGDDWDPALAPGPQGGFLIAWCDGQDHGRDIFARFHDARGKPLTDAIAISPRTNEQDFPDVARLADGSWVVAWEDDLSAYDHTYVRRLYAGERFGAAGPIVTLNPRPTTFNENRGAPRVAATPSGFVAVYADCSRQKGFDVRVRALGLGFDRVSGAGAGER